MWLSCRGGVAARPASSADAARRGAVLPGNRLLLGGEQFRRRREVDSFAPTERHGQVEQAGEMSCDVYFDADRGTCSHHGEKPSARRATATRCVCL
jgi:hypothetical protein